MNVSEYVNTLVEMLKKDPEIANLEVIYSQDDEGNSFQKVVFTPTFMKTKGLQNQYVEVIVEEVDIDEIDKDTTALCIN